MRLGRRTPGQRKHSSVRRGKIQISMKQNRASVKFNISLKNASEEESEDYNIHNFVIVRFQVKPRNSKKIIFIKMKKHEYAKDWTFTVKASSTILNMNKIINCSENWTDWIYLDYDTDEWVVDVDIKINFIKTYPIIIKKIHEDETLTDFQLSANDGSVAVHKSFLAAHSDMFKTMLHGEWKETAQGRVELKGVTRQTLQHFKDFIYLGTLPDENDELRPLLLLADRYLVANLKAECMMKVMQTIKPENLDTHLEFAVENKMHDLKDNILKYIPDSVFASACAIKMDEALMDKNETSSSDKE